MPFPSPGDLPDPGIEPRSPALQADALTSEPQESLFQTKRQDKIPEELSDMKIGIYSQRVQINKDKELGRMSAQSEKLEVLSKESENIKE